MKNWLPFSMNHQFDDSNNNNNDIESEEQTTLLKKITSTAKETIEVEVNYTMFFIVLGTGLLFIIISFLYLPFVLLYPWKFSAFFSFGSFLFLLSFIFVYGTCGFINILFKKERIAFTLIYIVSLIIGNILSHKLNLYLIVLLCSGVQLLTVGIFFISFIPGGISGLRLVLGAMKIPFFS